MEAEERMAVERELASLMEVTLNLENELAMLLVARNNWKKRERIRYSLVSKINLTISI